MGSLEVSKSSGFEVVGFLTHKVFVNKKSTKDKVLSVRYLNKRSTNLQVIKFLRSTKRSFYGNKFSIIKFRKVNRPEEEPPEVALEKEAGLFDLTEVDMESSEEEGITSQKVRLKIFALPRR